MWQTDKERQYIRQTQLADFGHEGQALLRRASVLVIGAGGLGAPLLTYLATAGVGRIGIIDDDRVELSNLNRQMLFEMSDIGRLKVEAARDRLEEIAPDIHIEAIAEKLQLGNASSLFANYDIIADGCDNFATRFAVNTACVHLNKPLISAAISGYNGQISTFFLENNPHAPCYACFVSPDAPEANTCRDIGALGAVCGLVGSMQALEVIHTILKRPQLIGTLLRIDGKNFLQRKVALRRDPDCPCCKTIPR